MVERLPYKGLIRVQFPAGVRFGLAHSRPDCGRGWLPTTALGPGYQKQGNGENPQTKNRCPTVGVVEIHRGKICGGVSAPG